jgi:hypothetical protein
LSRAASKLALGVEVARDYHHANDEDGSREHDDGVKHAA